MKSSILLALSAGIVMQFMTSAILAYIAGNSGVISFLGGNSVAFLVGIFIAIGIARAFSVRNSGWLYVGLLVVMLTAGLFSRPLVISVFASGFKKKALQQASIQEWKGLLLIADRLISLETKDRATVLPKFIDGVWAGHTPHLAVTGESLEKTSVSLRVWWRSAGVCVGFDIGKSQTSRSPLHFRQSISEEMVVVVFPDR